MGGGQARQPVVKRSRVFRVENTGDIGSRETCPLHGEPGNLKSCLPNLDSKSLRDNGFSLSPGSRSVPDHDKNHEHYREQVESECHRARSVRV